MSDEVVRPGREMRYGMACLGISKYSTSIVCGQGVQSYTIGEVERSSRFCAARGSMPSFYARNIAAVCHRRQRQDF